MKSLVWSGNCMRSLLATTGVQAADLPCLPTPRPFTLDDLFACDGCPIRRSAPTATSGLRRHHGRHGEERHGGDHLAGADGGRPPRQLTGGPKHDRHPRFSPDGKQILFESRSLGRDATVGHRPGRRRSAATDHDRHRAPTAASGRPTASRSRSCRPSIPSTPTSPMPRATRPTRSGPKRSRRTRSRPGSSTSCSIATGIRGSRTSGSTCS